MEHDLVLLELREHRVLPRHVLVHVQSALVLLPTSQPHAIAQKVEKVLEGITAVAVGEEFVVQDLAAFGVDDAELEVHGALLFLQAQKITLKAWMADLKGRKCTFLGVLLLMVFKMGQAGALV